MVQGGVSPAPRAATSGFWSLPNLLTYGRIIAIPALVACFFATGDWGRWTAMWIFIAAGVSDFLDGYLARAWQQQSAIGRMGNFVFHIGRGELKCGGETVRLTERERELLRYFAQRPGMPVSRHELARDDGENGGERAIDVQINRLRRKIEKDPANPVYLQTVRGKGYILYPE